ncbi:hypothetical protein G3480_21205 [Thiorhodococcus mannitoliphagus]|uniref:Uncharacterized protein n=1 Tax=Thiorhodococcus mannitoliphagus TaxID=329406 RepID=A0A6P1DYN2_9GAMM|nr:hypothetical protein [Thiorhodococcus mannitoliphagus]NEX22789.1 hypothetical protein [Thiorhodococcus mannitoliphagus]
MEPGIREIIVVVVELTRLDRIERLRQRQRSIRQGNAFLEIAGTLFPRGCLRANEFAPCLDHDFQTASSATADRCVFADIRSQASARFPILAVLWSRVEFAVPITLGMALLTPRQEGWSQIVLETNPASSPCRNRTLFPDSSRRKLPPHQALMLIFAFMLLGWSGVGSLARRLLWTVLQVFLFRPSDKHSAFRMIERLALEF